MNINKLLGDYIPKEVVEYLNSIGKSKILSYNKLTEHYDKKSIYRKYISLGETPKFNPQHPKSYMFSDNKYEISSILEQDAPPWIKEVISAIKNMDYRYNQFVINLYNNGKDFMEAHSDCDANMVQDYTILIASFGASRTIQFTGRGGVTGKFSIETITHPLLKLNKFLNTSFRHEILRDDTKLPRVSVTARMMLRGVEDSGDTQCRHL